MATQCINYHQIHHMMHIDIYKHLFENIIHSCRILESYFYSNNLTLISQCILQNVSQMLLNARIYYMTHANICYLCSLTSKLDLKMNWFSSLIKWVVLRIRESKATQIASLPRNTYKYRLAIFSHLIGLKQYTYRIDIAYYTCINTLYKITNIHIFTMYLLYIRTLYFYLYG